MIYRLRNIGLGASPAVWVPTLYFAEGLPYNFVNGVLPIMYKNLGLANAEITLYTGLAALFWTFKFLWAPFVERYAAVERWVVATQVAAGVLMVAMAFSLPLSLGMTLSLGLMWMVALVSATHDIAADGTFLRATTARQRAQYVGLQGLSWTLAKASLVGSLIYVSGRLHGAGWTWSNSWSPCLAAAGVVMFALAAWHRWALRAASEPASGTATRGGDERRGALRAFFARRRLVVILAFILLYRVGQGLIDQMAPLFLVDTMASGGLGLTNEVVGQLNGVLGSLGTMAGALLAGAWVARVGLRRWVLLVLFASMALPSAVYVLLSTQAPDALVVLGTLVIVEKFGAGFGEVGLLLYMMQLAGQGRFQASHYALATGLAALGYSVGAVPSGWMQQILGYPLFFSFALVAFVPGLVACFAVPLHSDGASPKVAE